MFERERERERKLNQYCSKLKMKFLSLRLTNTELTKVHRSKGRLLFMFSPPKLS